MITKSLLRKMVVMCVIGLTLSATAFSQSSNGLWQAIGSDTVFTNRIVKANRALVVLQKIVAKDIFASGNVQVAGQVVSQTALIKGTLQVGDSGAFFWIPNTLNPQTDLYMSDIGRMAIGTGNAGGPTTFSSILLGVGVTNPLFTLDVANDINVTPSAANQGYRIGGVVVLQKPDAQYIFS